MQSSSEHEAANEVIVPPPNVSEFTILMEESLRVNDPSNFVEDVTKKSRKALIEFLNAYNPLMETAENKRVELQESDPQKLEEFKRHYTDGIWALNRETGNTFKKFRRAIEKY